MIIAYAHGADLVGSLLLLTGSAIAGIVSVRGRRRQVELELGRRTYPCSHGATGDQRWGYRPR